MLVEPCICGAGAVVHISGGKCSVHCSECLLSTKLFAKADEAISSWNNGEIFNRYPVKTRTPIAHDDIFICDGGKEKGPTVIGPDALLKGITNKSMKSVNERTGKVK